MPTMRHGERVDEVKGIRDRSPIVVNSGPQREQASDRELIDSRRLCAVTTLRTDIRDIDKIGRNVGKQEPAETEAQLIDFRWAKIMRLGDRQKTIPLGVRAWKSQIAGSAKGLSSGALIPEPTSGDVIYRSAHVAIVTNRILVIFHRSDSI